jgi:hypothetical protein
VCSDRMFPSMQAPATVAWTMPHEFQAASRFVPIGKRTGRWALGIDNLRGSDLSHSVTPANPYLHNSERSLTTQPERA